MKRGDVLKMIGVAPAVPDLLNVAPAAALTPAPVKNPITFRIEFTSLVAGFVLGRGLTIDGNETEIEMLHWEDTPDGLLVVTGGVVLDVDAEINWFFPTFEILGREVIGAKWSFVRKVT